MKAGERSWTGLGLQGTVRLGTAEVLYTFLHCRVILTVTQVTVMVLKNAGNATLTILVYR